MNIPGHRFPSTASRAKTPLLAAAALAAGLACHPSTVKAATYLMPDSIQTFAPVMTPGQVLDDKETPLQVVPELAAVENEMAKYTPFKTPSQETAFKWLDQIRTSLITALSRPDFPLPEEQRTAFLQRLKAQMYGCVAYVLKTGEQTAHLWNQDHRISPDKADCKALDPITETPGPKS